MSQSNERRIMSLRNTIIFQLITPFSILVTGYYYLSTSQYFHSFPILRIVGLPIIAALIGQYLYHQVDQPGGILNRFLEEDIELIGLVKLPNSLLFDFKYKLLVIFGLLFSSTTKTETYASIIEYQTQFNFVQGESQIGTFYLGCHEIPTNQEWCSLSRQRQQYHMRQIKQHLSNVQQVLQKQIPGVKFRFLTRSELLQEHGFDKEVSWDNEIPMSGFISLGTVKVTKYNNKVFLLTKESPDNPKEKEYVLLSIIGVTTDLKDNFHMLNRAPEGQREVSTWRWNRVEEQHKKGWITPRKVYTTQNYIVIKSSFQETGSFFDLSLEQLYDQILETRKDVLSLVKNGFKCTDIEKGALIQVFLHKKPVEAGKGKVRYDQAYLRVVAQLTRVPSRVIPILPYSRVPVNIPLGTHFTNPEKIAGLGELSGLLVYCGSDQNLMIGALHHFIKTIVTPDRKIILFDFNNDFGNLPSVFSRSQKESIPITKLQLGKNFSFNLYDVEMPPNITNYNAQTAYQMNTVVHMLTYASETDELMSNRGQLRHAMIEVAKKINPKELKDKISLQKITSSEIFVDVFQSTDHLTIDRLRTELEYFTTVPEFNEGKNSKRMNELGRAPGLTVIQFPTQTHAHKRLAFVFLLQKLAARCDPQTVIIVTHASKLFRNNQIHTQDLIFEEAISPFYAKIHHSGCLVLATHSITNLHPEVQKDITTGVFFRLLNAEDRDWLSVRYALEAKLTNDVPNVSAFLKSIQGEGLLFREDNIHTCDHFVPFTLGCVESIEDNEHRSIPPSLNAVILEKRQFALLMTVLSHIQTQAVTEQSLLQYLQELGFSSSMTDWAFVRQLPYVNLSENGNDQLVSISDEGRAYYLQINTLLQQLPPPIALESSAIDSTLSNLRQRVNQSFQNNLVKHQQLKTVIEEVAGGLLNEYLSVQDGVDWPLVKKYEELLDIEGLHPDHHTQRFVLLELMYAQMEDQLQEKPPL
jgi:hypothetical protein